MKMSDAASVPHRMASILHHAKGGFRAQTGSSGINSWIPLNRYPTLNPAKVRALCAKAGLDVDDDIIIYCFKGARASNTFIALKMAGFNKIRNHYGSWNEWSRDPALPIDGEVLAGV